MPKKLPQRDPIGAYQRKSTGVRRVGEDAQCASCGKSRALNAKSEPIMCEGCQRKKRGKRTMDNHHIAGKANSPITTSIPANDHHAQLNVAQQDWPKKTLENRDGCPLLRAAACLRGFVDTVVYYFEIFVLWVAEMLELLSDYLIEAWGHRWWLNTEFARFAPNGGLPCRSLGKVHCPIHKRNVLASASQNAGQSLIGTA